MNIINLLFSFYFIVKISAKSNNYEFLIEKEIFNNNNYLDLLNLTKNLNTILGAINSTIKSPCIQSLDQHYHNNDKEIEKIYEGSSKGFVEMNSFSTCINNNSNTFFSIYPNYSDSALEDIARLNDNLEEHLWIFGICLKKDICDPDDVKLIFNSVNSLFNNTFKLYNKDNIIVDDYRKSLEKFLTFSNIFLNILPSLSLVIQLLFMMIKIIPVKMFICCLRRKYLRELDKDKNKEKEKINNIFNSDALDRQISTKIKKCFSISVIIDDFIYSNKSELFKDEDMTYLKGIKTLGTVLFILGFNFVVLYNYPLCVSERHKRESYMKNFGTALLVICFRLSPALILSASGYSLCYKFLNFLDKKLANIALDSSEENNIENNNNFNDTISSKDNKENSSNNLNKIVENTLIKNNSNKKNDLSSKESSKGTDVYENSLGIKFYNKDIIKNELNKIFKNQKINEKLFIYKISTKEISFYVYLGFIIRQLHKFFLFLLGIIIFKYSFPFIYIMFVKAPLINYIYQALFLKLGNFSWNYLYVGNFLDLFTETDTYFMMELYCIPMCEYNYFVICSLIIFICYKKKLQLDIIICVLILLFLIFKIVYISIDLTDRNPGMFYTYTSYQKFFFNPIYNFDYFLIGMFFGLLNYVVQNGLTQREILKQRPFIRLPLKLLGYTDYQKNKNYIYFVVIVIVMLFSFIITPLLFSKTFEKTIENNNPNIFFVIFSLIDVEVFIFCFHFILISCYISGRNIFFKIFNAHISSYGMILSYWIIFYVPTSTYLCVYGNESNINLSLFMVLLYSAISLIKCVLIAILFLFMMEMPYKKLIKLYFNIVYEINEVYLEEESDESSSMNITELNEKDMEGDNNEILKDKEEDVESDIKD